MRVVRLAKRRGAEVILLDVLEHDDPPLVRDRFQRRMQALHRLASKLRRAGVHVTVRVRVAGYRRPEPLALARRMAPKMRAAAGVSRPRPLSIGIMAEATELSAETEGLPFQITPKAVAMAKQKVADGPEGVLGLRLGIRGGGCSGYAYVFDFATKVRPKRDRVYDFDGLKVVVDDRSVKFLEGATLEWEEKLLGYGFKWSNPQATGGCGCGASFTT